MKKFWRSTAMTVLLFVLAIGLLSAGTIGGTQAALSARSSNYYSALDLDHIGVALYENGVKVDERTFTDSVDGAPVSTGSKELTLDLGSDSEIKIGKQYPFAITAENTGTIDQYVRVTIRKYWVDSTGAKVQDTSYLPRYVLLDYKNQTDTADRQRDSYNETYWIRDESAHTDERDVYYYKGILPWGSSNVTEPLFSDLSISKYAAKDVVVKTTTVGNTTMTEYQYAYNDYSFVVEAVVDAVQTHHASAAITSAWGTSNNVMTQMGITIE